MGIATILCVIAVLLWCLLIILTMLHNSKKSKGTNATASTMIETTIILTIRNIIKWEQLNNKPFSSMDYNDENDIISLFYVCTMSDEVGITLHAFKENLTDEVIMTMVKSFEKQILIDAQFQITSDKVEKDKTTDPVYIKDIVPILIMNGLDVNFALDEMALYDLPIYLKAYDQKTRHTLESSRLWSFIQVMPHLSQNVKSPKDLYPFPWELEDEVITEEEKRESKEVFSSFFNKGLKTE